MRRPLLLAVTASGLVVGVLAGIIWFRYLRSGPPAAFDDPIEHFKYGSIGAEVEGIPFSIWKSLPKVCPTLARGGYEQFGFISEPGHALPVGVSVRKYQLERVGFNCATCHTAMVQGANGVLLGSPSGQLDLAGYARFVLACGTSDAFTPDRVLDAMEATGVPLDALDRLIYRYVILPRARDGFRERARAMAWMDNRPPHGPGRTDAFNPWRQRFGLNPAADTMVATVDFPSVWNQKVRESMWLHWDADNNSLHERNLSAALAGGATEASVDLESIARVNEWLQTLTPPAYPFPIDRVSAQRGRQLYVREGCDVCHDVGGSRVGQSTPLDEIGTDPARTRALTPEVLKYMLSIGTGYPWRFTHYRLPDGYANSPLDGIWARSPYLHNGSVPTLADLMSPVDTRPRTFGRGCREFDPVKVGYRCDGPFRFSVDAPGNGNGGHPYGTSLDDEERRALVEYLKTL